MTTHRLSFKAYRFATASAMAAILLTGCASSAHLGRASNPEPQMAKQGTDQAIARAEAAVAKSPRGASLRTELGMAYLTAGRFESAITAFNDAMSLGDNSARTALGLSLAKSGAGRGKEAVAILNDWRESIPASDLGLALALAGESTRGVAILADALRAGENTPKLRQNLAFAYALDGRWREARTMMEQDVPADQIDQRISDWAMQAKPDDFQKRVAGILGAPIRTDPGQPQRLALANTPSAEQLAAEATAAPQQAAATLPKAASHPVSVNSELPALGEAPAPVLAAVSAPVAVAESAAPSPAVVAAAELPAPGPAPVRAPAHSASFDSAFVMPAAAPLPAAPQRRAVRPVHTAATVRIALPAPKKMVARNGSHLVQLGSFASAQGARRGWGLMAARNPSLREYRMVITPAVVNGKHYWRVAAAGFDARSAAGMCSSVKGRGGVCFAYAATHAPASGSPAPSRGVSGPQMARRR